MLISSYSKSLHRARIRDGRVATLELIQLRKRNGRIRDLIEDSHGRIVLMFDTGSIAIAEPIDSGSNINNGKMTLSMKGEMLFSSCTGCHTISGEADHGIGPDLAQIVNRPIASVAGYNYSEGLKSISGSWSEENLATHLTRDTTHHEEHEANGGKN